ncbi:MAG: carbamoyltransferase [Methanolobus sp.]|nr:carbamoyltransferase [Methanolobus sp.]
MITVGIFGIQDVGSGPYPTYTHDHGIALMKDGKVLTTIQLERYTRKKYDNRLPTYISELLDKYLPCDEEVRFVNANSFSGSSFISRDGRMRIEPDSQMDIENILFPAEVKWYDTEGRQKEAAASIICHEFAHIASALPFVGKFLPNSLLVHIDGGASRSACSFWYWDGSYPRLLEASWDLLKSQVNNFNVNPLAMAVLNQESWQHLSLPGKLMGYCGLGNPNNEMSEWLRLNNWFLDFQENGASMLDILNRRWSTSFTDYDNRSSFFMDLCATIQRDFEERIVQEILKFQEITGADNLYYSGGAALNIPTNRCLETSGRFRKIFIPPVTSDSGLALGAAAWVEYLEYGKLDINGPFLNRFGIEDRSEYYGDNDNIKKMLLDQKVLGVCNGSSEAGPRALGHRSMIGLACSKEIKVRLSEQIKRREWYRPLAPILCDSAAKEVLEDSALQSELSSFMLGAYEMQDTSQSGFEGVIHGNNLLRAQVIRSKDRENQWMYRLLSEMWEEHGIPGLINTSFNQKGEPIIHHPSDAFEAAVRMGLDGVVIDGSLHMS